jgi:hypothetical protein
LERETEHLGIKSLLIEPGRFRTKLLSTGNLNVVQSTIPEYMEASKGFIQGLAMEDQTQPGNTEKAVEIILDLVRNEGCAVGREVPFRLPLGTDCYESVKAKCEATLKLLEDWENVIKSTNYPT